MPRRRDLDPEQVEDLGLVQAQQLLAGPAVELLGQHRGRRGRDRAALALERDVADAAVLAEGDEDVLLVTAERVRVLEVEVETVGPAEVARPLVVVEDVLAVEVVHGPALQLGDSR